MQYDSNGNCHYCGYGPTNRNPNWCNWKQHCTLTHAYDPPENAVNIEAWRKKNLLAGLLIKLKTNNRNKRQKHARLRSLDQGSLLLEWSRQ